jgi:hypothetical protein
MKKLIDYIIKEPILDSPKRGYKYPFYSCEILTCDANFILDKFFQDNIIEDKLERNASVFFNLNDSFIIAGTDEEFIDTFEKKDSVIDDKAMFNPPAIEYCGMGSKEFKEIKGKDENWKEMSLDTVLIFLIMYLFNFLMTSSSNFQADLNPVLSGYFSKVVISLLKFKPTTFFKYICIKKPEYLKNIISQIKNKSISEIISKILLAELSSNLEENVGFDTIKINILNKILTISNKDDLLNVQDIIMDYLENSKNLDIILSDSFLNTLSNQIQFTAKMDCIDKEYIHIASNILCHFKSEYEKAQKFMTSMSMSMIN